MQKVCAQWLPDAFFLGITSEEKTYCAIDEDPQELSCNGLQPLATVQLPQNNLTLQDVVFQDDLEHSLIHGHHLICSGKKTFWSIFHMSS